MAVLAQVRGLDVSCVLGIRRTAVVADETTTGNAGMIESGGRPRARGMTVIAGIAARDMIRKFAGCGNPVMTAGTGPGHIGMIKPGRNPGTGGMAIVAAVATGNMARRLARRNRPVMTACTGPDYGIVIETHQRRPDPLRVTVLAHVQALDMVGRFRCSGHPAALAVTQCALRRRALEDSAHMAQ